MPPTSHITAQKERVCIMQGRARLACFGCPVLSCSFNQQPFADLDETLMVAARAAELLRTNRVWLLNDDQPVSGRQLYESLGEHPEGELLARLYEARDAFAKNLAVEGVAEGVLSPWQGSTLARMRMTGHNSPRNIDAFLAMVRERDALKDLPIEPGEQRHTRAIPSDVLATGGSLAA